MLRVRPVTAFGRLRPAAPRHTLLFRGFATSLPRLRKWPYFRLLQLPTATNGVPCHTYSSPDCTLVVPEYISPKFMP